MAERLNVKEMLAAARKGGAVKAESEPAEAAIEVEAPTVEVVVAPTAAPSVVAAAAPLGRPLTMKEKLAAARGGAAPPPPAAPVPVAAQAADATETVVVVPTAAAVAMAVPTAESLGRPLTMKEKLAAARGGTAPPPPAAGVAAKPAASKPAAPAVAAKAAARELPPLDKITDPRDLAEALRRAGADKDAAAKADAAARAASAAGATPATSIVAAKAAAAKKLESKAIPPKPTKEGTAAATTAPPGSPESAPIGRRPLLWGMGIGAIIVTGWANFTFALTAQTLACVRFMFPNVLAEPPSTIKVGPAAQFDPEQVNDRWKAEWGFWIVRSAAYDGEDKIYAIQSVCTHLGCPPNWLAAETKFKCPCHGSGFYISGVNFEGPAPRPLERFKVAVNDAGEIVVDKGQKFQEELKQWSDPDSFIIA